MRVPRTVAIIIGALTAWPIIYAVFFIVWMALVLSQPDPQRQVEMFHSLLLLHIIAMTSIIILLVFYLTHVFRNTALKVESRIMWAFAVLLAGAFVAPFYWWKYIWRSPSQNEATI